MWLSLICGSYTTIFFFEKKNSVCYFKKAVETLVIVKKIPPVRWHSAVVVLVFQQPAIGSFFFNVSSKKVEIIPY